MASNIIPDTIDEEFPVAGEDNDSQGFRDNFNIIKNNFTFAKTEIEDLQDNTAKTNADNVFFENTLSRYTSLQQTHTHSDSLSGISVDAELNFQSAHYFTITAQANIELTLAGWPTNDEYAEMYIQIYGGGAARTVTFASEYSTGLTSQMYVDSTFGGAASITTSIVTTESIVVKAFTYNNGVDVFLSKVGDFEAV